MKYFIWSLGCQMNKSDSERLATLLEQAGLIPAQEKEADLILTVACSVRQTAIDRIYGKAKVWQEAKKHRPLITILSGCVLSEDKEKMASIFDLIFDTNDTQKLTSFLKANVDLGSIKSFFDIHPKYESEFQAYVPISTGCNNFCTYCAVPFTRGREVSRPSGDIIAEVNDLVNRNYKEITLLGQNVNSYGNDLNVNYDFADLIKEIDKIPGDHRVYFYSNHPKDMTDKLIQTMSGLVHFPHYIHLPLQSGSDKIIKAMNRHYTQEKYLALAKKIKMAMPDVAITTDVILGFPSENEEDFDATIKVFEQVKYSMAFIAKYSSRPGTVAAKMKDNVTKEVKDRRFRKLTDLQAKIMQEDNAKLVGKKVKVLIDGKKGAKHYGRTDDHRVVELDKKVSLGQFAQVKISKANSWFLIGQVRDSNA